MSESRKDQLSGLVFLAFSIFLYAGSYAIKMSKADTLGPQFFPRIVAIVMGVLSVIQLFGSTCKNLKEKGQKVEKKPFTFNYPLLLSIALLLGYYFLLKPVASSP